MIRILVRKLAEGLPDVWALENQYKSKEGKHTHGGEDLKGLIIPNEQTQTRSLCPYSTNQIPIRM